MKPRARAYRVTSARRSDGALSVVEVSGGGCVMSSGECLLIRYEKLQALAEQVCQDRCEVWIRTWTSRDGEELIDLHRVGVMRSGPFTDSSLSNEVF